METQDVAAVGTRQALLLVDPLAEFVVENSKRSDSDVRRPLEAPVVEDLLAPILLTLNPGRFGTGLRAGGRHQEGIIRRALGVHRRGQIVRDDGRRRRRGTLFQQVRISVVSTRRVSNSRLGRSWTTVYAIVDRTRLVARRTSILGRTIPHLRI